MATRRKVQQKRQRKPAKRRPQEVDEDLALAEEILRKSRGDHAIWVAGSKKLMRQLGIRVKPIGAKKLQERLLKKGFDPESNEFSREIIALREE